MTLTPLLTAPPLIQAHVAAALLALVFGALALARRRRDRWHRAAGAGFVGSILTAALTSFGIREGGGFSWIHILSVLTLIGTTQGLWYLARGDRHAHGQAMRALYAQALILAGIFTLLPGRRMSLTLFPDAPWMGFAAVAVLGAVVAAWLIFPSSLRRARRLFSRPSVTRMWRNW